MSAPAVASGAPTASADALLAREYERLKPDILRTLRGKLAARGIHFHESDLEAFYNQAWHGVYAKLAAGEAIDNRAGLLVTIAERRAVDELRSLRPERRAAAEELDGHAVDPDLAGRLDDHVRLKRFVEGLRGNLSERERKAAALCYVQDFTRTEAAEAIGVSPRRMEKIMDGVSKKVGAFVRDIAAGEWCESRRSLMKAYALGLLDVGGDRHRLAAEHLDDCSACRHRVLCWRGLAALTPPLPAVPLLVGGSSGGAARRLRRPTPRQAAVAAGAATALAAAALAASPFDDPTEQASPAQPAARSTSGGQSATPPPTAAASSGKPASRRKASRPSERRAKRRSRPTTRATQTPRPAETPTPRPAATPAPPAATAIPAPSPAPAPAEPPRDHDGAGEFELR
jgi:DNA-directed RNA polymerase specialized sigma24 family protein